MCPVRATRGTPDDLVDGGQTEQLADKSGRVIYTVRQQFHSVSPLAQTVS